MNTEVTEHSSGGLLLEPSIEVNISTDSLQNMLHNIFDGWEVEKETVVPQTWSIPREGELIIMATNVVSFVTKRLVE